MLLKHTDMKIEINETKKWQFSFTLKIILLTVMGLMLLIPLEMVKSVTRERQQNSEKVRQEIAMQWAGKQNVSGPVLNIPVKIIPKDEKSQPYKILFHLMPEDLNISGNVTTERRHRSIYEAVVYNTDMSLSGNFQVPEISTEERSEILWNEAYMTLGISDNRGIRGNVVLNTGALSTEAVPGLRDTEVFSSGITFPLSLNDNPGQLNFDLAFNLSGSEDLGFAPLGKTTKVSLTSPWTAPGFNGNFLPEQRSIDDSGFRASWLITNLNRNFPQSWKGSEFKPANDSFGVEFVLQADHYQKSLRSAKYGILFIALTFLALIFAEVTTGENLHIMTYLLVALALVLFFSMLTALSEHIGFNPAYMVAALSTISLVFLFLWRLIKNHKPVILTGLLLLFLYSFIFILLTLNDYAFLAGNIGLFILLALTMVFSVRFKLFRRQES